MSEVNRHGSSSIDRTPPNSPKLDRDGKPVEVVKKAIEQSPDAPTDTIDKVITPTGIKTSEQEAQTIRQRLADAERAAQRKPE